MMIRDAIPEMYGNLLPDFFAKPLEPERYSTCNACAMCSHGQNDEQIGRSFFRPDTKCCTYHPRLPNYAVGALLVDGRMELASGKQRIREKIAARVGVHPRGIDAPRKYSALYRLAPEAFGKATSLICPYFDSNRGECTVWPYREAVCSTYYCKHNHGHDGLSFWTAMKSYLSALERALSNFALLELGWPPKDLLQERYSHPHLNARELDDLPPAADTYEAEWGQWTNQEEDLYRRTYDVIRNITRSDAECLGGLELKLREATLELEYQRMTSPVMPSVLMRNPALKLQRTLNGDYLVSAYNLAPIELKQEVVELLAYFDGHRTVSEVQSHTARERDIVFSDELLTKLSQFRVLVEPVELRRRYRKPLSLGPADAEHGSQQLTVQ